MKKKQTSLEKISNDIEENVKKEIKIIDKFRKRNEDRLLFAAFVIVMCSLVVINTIYVINRLPAKQDKSTPSLVSSPLSVLPSTLSATNGTFQVSVLSAKEDSSTDQAFGFQPNETMLIATLTIKNLSSKKQQIQPSSQFYVRSSDGSTYQMHPSSHLSKELSVQDVEAGQSTTGQVSFVIPKVLTKPLLYVDLGWEDRVPVVYDVLH